MTSHTTTMTNDTNDTGSGTDTNADAFEDFDGFDADERIPPWRLRAHALSTYGGIPPKRAKVVALREWNRQYKDIIDELDLASVGTVYNQLREFNKQHREAAWLVENTEPFENISDDDEEGDGT